MTTTDSSAPTTSDAATDLAACQQSITQVLNDQATVAQTQTDLLAGINGLNAAVTSLSSANAAAASTGSTTTTRSGSAPATGSASGSVSADPEGVESGIADSGSAGADSAGADAAGSGSGAGAAGDAAADAATTTSSSAAATRSASSGAAAAGAGSSATAAGSSGGATGATAGGASSTPATAEDIVADQAQIDLAVQNVAIAQADLDRITLTAPISGTVGLISMAVGDSVSASSTTSTITIVGDGGYQVSTTAALSIIDKVQVGEKATVTVNSSAAPLTGVVSAISVLKSTSTTNTTTYPVTILLDPTDLTLYNGSSGSVAITVGQVDNVLTVPSSAVHAAGSSHTVSVLAGGVVTSTPVEIGSVGSDLTEITSGLTAGQDVVLADLSAALPTATTTSTGSSNLLGGNSTTAARAGGAGARAGR